MEIRQVLKRSPIAKSFRANVLKSCATREKETYRKFRVTAIEPFFIEHFKTNAVKNALLWQLFLSVYIVFLRPSSFETDTSGRIADLVNDKMVNQDTVTVKHEPEEHNGTPHTNGNGTVHSNGVHHELSQPDGKNGHGSQVKDEVKDPGSNQTAAVYTP